MGVYGSWLSDAIDDHLSGETIKAMLVDDTYVFDPDATTAPTGDEVSGTGYTAGGVDVTSDVAVSYDSTNNRVMLDVTADVNFGDITVTGIGGIVFYIDGGKPLAADMFGSTDWPGGDDFVYTPSASGILTIGVGT